VSDFELRLQQALRPVDPPEGLAERLEVTMEALSELAADELEGWELRAMRDPRNWARPAAAITVGTAATAALVVLRVRAQQRRRAARDPIELAGRVAGEVRRALSR
jgi:hypothetical protein